VPWNAGWKVQPHSALLKLLEHFRRGRFDFPPRDRRHARIIAEVTAERQFSFREAVF
jgi:hypothetical protein